MRTPFTRRGFIGGALALAAGAGQTRGAMRSPAALAATADRQPFMDQYYDGIIRIAEGIRDTQIGAICAAMTEAWERYRNGGTLLSQVVFGHFAMYAGSAACPGQPNILPQGDIQGTDATYGVLKPGDFLLTDIVDDKLADLRARGIYIAGVTNNYFRFNRTPPGFLRPERMEIALEDVSDIVIDSQVPWYNGLVNAPEITEFRICPSTGIAQYLVYWSCTAALAALMGSKGKADPSEPVRRYLDLALDRFALIGADRPKVDRVAADMAGAIVRGARFMAYGEPFLGPGRTGNMFVSEVTGAASGPMFGLGYSSNVRENDIVLIGSVRTREPGEMEVARAARAAGARTYAFCPFTERGDASGERLFKEVDTAFDTWCDEPGGVLEIAGFDEPVCPLTGLTGNLVLWLLLAQTTDHIARRGEMPYYWMGFHENGGQEYDVRVRPYFQARGY